MRSSHLQQALLCRFCSLGDVPYYILINGPVFLFVRSVDWEPLSW